MRPASPGGGTGSIVRLSVVDSTQSVAWALAADGAGDRTVVVADCQTAGRGRRGRHWQAEPRTSLLASMIVRPRLPARFLPTLSLATAVAVANAVSKVAPLTPRLKWPNDVVTGGERKRAGMLLEARGSGPVVIGIGGNLTQERFPEPLAGRATSILLETGCRVEPDGLLPALLEEFDEWRERLESEGFAPVRRAWLALSDTLGRLVTVDGVGGTTVDIDDDGALLVDDGSNVHRVLAAELGEVADDAARR